MSKITITVTGAAGVGKSAISQALHEFLEENGFNATLNFINDEHEPRNEDDLMDALDSIRERVEIEIVEKQARGTV